MSEASIASLITPLSTDEVRGSIYNVLAATGVTTSTWKPGAVVRTIISGVSIVLAGLSVFIAFLARSAFLPLATGEWLRLVALYTYNVVRIEATFASGTVTLTNSSGGIYTVAAGGLVVRNPTTRKTYVNASGFTLGAGATLDVIVIATEVGSGSTSFVGEVSEMVTGFLGVTCSNAAPLVGTDVEADPALRLRCTDKLGSLSPNGPSDAYGYFSRSAKRADGSSIGVTRVRAVPGVGRIDLYAATATGGVPGTANDLNTDLGRIDDLLQRNVVPLCVVLQTWAASTVSVPVTYKLWLYNTSGLTEADIKAAVVAELEAYFATTPIGGTIISGGPGTLYVSELHAVIGRARYNGTPLPIARVDLLGPSDDVAMAVGSIPVLGTVSATITQLSTTGGI